MQFMYNVPSEWLKETNGFYTVVTVDSQNVYINDSLIYMCVSKE